MTEDDWADVCSRLHHHGWRVCLADSDGHVYLLHPRLGKAMRLCIDLFRDGVFLPEWARCYPTRDAVPADARAMFPVRKRWQWPKLRKKKMSKSSRRAYLDCGLDPDAHFYQIVEWHNPPACLAHLRRHLPGLHEITPKEHDAVAKAALDKAIAAKAGASKPREG